MPFLQLVLTSILFAKCDGARILVGISSPFAENQIVFQELWKGLLEKGHELTLLTTHSMNNDSLTNLEEILWHEPIEKNRVHQRLFAFTNYDYNLPLEIVDRELNYSKVKELLHEDREFDLVITEYHVSVLYALAELYNCPLLLISNTDLSAYMYHNFGNPAHPAYNPDLTLPYKHPLNFMQRFISTSVLYGTKLFYNLVVSKKENALIRKHFGRNFSTVQDLQERISAVLVNQNPILGHIRPLVPTIVPIGGALHIKPPQPLPQTVESFIESSPNGIIYVSLESISSKTLNIIQKSLEEVPYNSIMRYDGNLVSDTGKLLVDQWTPQQDILRHRGVKLFITHGGAQSVEEAIYFKVPMLMLPTHSDQRAMAHCMLSKDVALSLNHDAMKKKQFKSAILDLLENAKYRRKMKYLNELVHDQPFTGLETAIWWADYVIRNKGARHLKHNNTDIPWYQYLLLDIICFFLSIFLLMIFLIYLTIRIITYIVRWCCFKKKEKVQ
ncbi:hypothetical protein RI129_011050 [Pyrocoelia pectoralis]|uniref:UDP-glucuronosyltransferase n=1 Tax=Pyrocoelia pectoralis TaxID=417401 RepID=A0AAN7V5J0_9COLE